VESEDNSDREVEIVDLEEDPDSSEGDVVEPGGKLESVDVGAEFVPVPRGKQTDDRVKVDNVLGSIDEFRPPRKIRSWIL
jgi:hypothetical protein